ncbi:MAG: HNH endonuclease [Desulfobacteraceae bacterium]|nr:HNH endonuclease [Desulfobacteraceae bacterium]
MEKPRVKQLFRNLNVWKSGGQRAPHKPLLLLYVLGRCQQGKHRLIPYAEAEEDVKKLLADFGPPRRSHRPEYPFWHLQSDGIWELQNAENLQNRKPGSSPGRTGLLENNVRGGLTKEIYEAVCRDQKLLTDIAAILLDDSFPATYHDDVLQAAGINMEDTAARRIRDPYFRDRVLRAYEYQCAVCGFNVRLGQALVALEAAHIKWHQAGGPDNEANGIALCSMHHKLFDRGVFTLTDDRIVQVSDLANGTAGFREWLMAFHGKPIQAPQSTSYYPEAAFVDWHIREVFKGYSRQL